jgi:56kDa selenium binding protein (SBP56)
MKRWWFVSSAGLLLVALLSLGTRGAYSGNNEERCDGARCPKPEKTLYVFAGDQARVHPDFLAVIDFDEDSDDYGKVVTTVPLSPPGNIGNEPHHCHLSANKNVLGCGGLLSLLRGQPGIFFFDVSRPRSPKFLFATSAPESSITDEFLPLRAGGFLVTQMGSASGGAPGRVAEFDYLQNLVHEWPDNPPTDGFNPHGIDARPELNLLDTTNRANL